MEFNRAQWALSAEMPVDAHRVPVSLAKRAVARLRMSQSTGLEATQISFPAAVG
jgi:hypothetical protein